MCKKKVIKKSIKIFSLSEGLKMLKQFYAILDFHEYIFHKLPVSLTIT